MACSPAALLLWLGDVAGRNVSTGRHQPRTDFRNFDLQPILPGNAQYQPFTAHRRLYGGYLAGRGATALYRRFDGSLWLAPHDDDHRDFFGSGLFLYRQRTIVMDVADRLLSACVCLARVRYHYWQRISRQCGSMNAWVRFPG